MSRTYEPEFKKENCTHPFEIGSHIKSISEGMEYPSHAYPDGAMNSAKNAIPLRKPKLIMTNYMKENQRKNKTLTVDENVRI